MTRYGTVNGVAGTAMNKAVDSFEATGQIATQTSGVASPATTTYTYAPDLPASQCDLLRRHAELGGGQHD